MRFQIRPILLALGLTLAATGAAQACDTGMCGSGWMDRGGHSGSGSSSNSSSSGYGYGSGYGAGYGYGGAGGSGYGGAGGSANASNTNSNSNSLSNSGNSTNSANNTNNNSSQNTAYGGNASIATGAVQNTNTNSQTQSQSQSQNNSGNSNVAVSYTNIQKQQPVATAYAAPLVAGADTCMGSTSVGGQGITIGFSVATTWTDKNCNRLKNSRELNAMGMSVVACELLAMDKEVGEALRRAGASCGAFVQQQVVVQQAPPPPPVREEYHGCDQRCAPVQYAPGPDYGPPPAPKQPKYDGERG